LCNGELQKSLEARTGVVLTHSRLTPLHKTQYGVQFEAAMKKTGFKHVTVCDKTQEVLPSVKRFYLICRFMYLLIVIAAVLRLVPYIFIAGCKAGSVQYEAVQAGVGGYGIMYGEK
jgi:hypothetical protein